MLASCRAVELLQALGELLEAQAHATQELPHPSISRTHVESHLIEPVVHKVPHGHRAQAQNVGDPHNVLAQTCRVCGRQQASSAKWCCSWRAPLPLVGSVRVDTIEHETSRGRWDRRVSCGACTRGFNVDELLVHERPTNGVSWSPPAWALQADALRELVVWSCRARSQSWCQLDRPRVFVYLTGGPLRQTDRAIAARSAHLSSSAGVARVCDEDERLLTKACMANTSRVKNSFSA